MQEGSAWDWTLGKREIHRTTESSREYGWLEELYVSPDGEKIATVANVGEGEFTVLENGTPWSEEVYERIWNLRYSPDGRLTGLISDMGEFTLAVEGEPWEESYGYAWNPLYSTKGDVVACAIQQDMRYGIARNGRPWDALYENANHFALSPCGRATAAVVQVCSCGQAEIHTFQKGTFSIAVNGEAWPQTFVNCWTPVFDNDAKRVAAQVRTSLYDYTIAVNGNVWPTTYNCIWEPSFNPATGAVVAPVRIDGKWGMAQDDKLIWPAQFAQAWHQQFSPDGKQLYAIVAPAFGKWTLAQNGKAWKTLVSDMVADMSVSPDGNRAAALAKNGDTWTIICDDTLWNGQYPMAWQPVFSPDSTHAAAKVELADGTFGMLINGKLYSEKFEQLWNPTFNEDSTKMLIRGVQNDVFIRLVISLSDYL